MARQRQHPGRRGRARLELRPAGRAREYREYVVAVLALLGLALSAYLTYLYSTGASGAFCTPGSGCDLVRASPYSQLWGIPVSLVGILGYSAILGLSLWPRPTNTRRLLLYSLALAGFTFSLYLTYLELFVIKAICPYCVASAILSTVILAALLIPRPVVAGLSPKGLAYLSLFIIALTLASSVLSPTNLASGEVEEDYATSLARHLTASGAVMYGAYWFPHCNDQKALFGDAFRYVNSVECDPEGKNANPSLCKEKNIAGYPTWEIKGRFYWGRLSLEELAELSGYGQ